VPDIGKAVWRVEIPGGISADDPCLDGHFPGSPVVPGAVLLGYAARIIANMGLDIATIRHVKFLRALLPDQTFVVECVLKGDVATISWFAEDRLVARARAIIRQHDH